MRWATVTDVDARGVWVRSAWTSGVLGPLPHIGPVAPGDAVLVVRADDGMVVLSGTADGGTFEPVGEALRRVGEHEAKADPHPQYAPRSTRLSAGAGLTGGGTLEAERTIDVGAGEGITVDPDAVRVNRSTVDQWYADKATTVDAIDALWTGIDALLGDLTYVGTYNAATHRISSVSVLGADAGYIVGQPLPPAAAWNAKHYFLVGVGGPTSGTDGIYELESVAAYAVGDWILSNGKGTLLMHGRQVVVEPLLQELPSSWVHMSYSTRQHLATSVVTEPPIAGAPGQTVQQVLQALHDSRAYAHRQLSAGNGLTGGGDLTADRTLHVGAGTGLSVSADAVSVDRSVTDLWYDAKGAAAAAVTGHEAKADPHPQYQRESERGAADGYAPLDANAHIPTVHLPPLAVNDTFVVSSQAAMLALAAQRGDMAVRSDAAKTFVLSSDSPSTLADWKELIATGQVVSVNGMTGVVALNATHVGADTAGTASASMSAHTAAADPHPIYLNQTRGDARYVNTSGDTMTGTLTLPSQLRVTGLRNIDLIASSGTLDLQGDSGGWAMGVRVKGSAGTLYHGWMAQGGADVLSNLYAGGDYTNPWMRLSSAQITNHRMTQIAAGGLALSLKATDQDRVWMEFQPRLGASTRGGWIGYGSVGATALFVQSELGVVGLASSAAGVNLAPKAGSNVDLSNSPKITGLKAGDQDTDAVNFAQLRQKMNLPQAPGTNHGASWNTAVRAGVHPWLMHGSPTYNTDGPGDEGNNYFYVWNMAYGSGDVSTDAHGNNMTQLAVPYLSSGQGNLWFRSRYGGNWYGWHRVPTFVDMNVLVDKKADLTYVDSQDGKLQQGIDTLDERMDATQHGGLGYCGLINMSTTPHTITSLSLYGLQDFPTSNLLSKRQASGWDIAGALSGTVGPYFMTINGTGERDSTQFSQGTNSIKIVSAGTGSTAWCAGSSTTNIAPAPVSQRITVVPGQKVTIVSDVYSPNVTKRVYALFCWFDAAGALIGSGTSVDTGITTSSTWQQAKAVQTAPANAAWLGARVFVPGSVAGDVFHFDRLGVWYGEGGEWALPGDPIGSDYTHRYTIGAGLPASEGWNAKHYFIVQVGGDTAVGDGIFDGNDSPQDNVPAIDKYVVGDWIISNGAAAYDPSAALFLYGKEHAARGSVSQWADSPVAWIHMPYQSRMLLAKSSLVTTPLTKGNVQDELEYLHALKFQHGDVVQTRNSFGGRQLYFDEVQNAMFLADVRWSVSGRLYRKSDNADMGAMTGLSLLFDGNYEAGSVVPAGQYGVITIDFNGNYPSHPYGPVVTSFYYDEVPESVGVRVYCNHAPHGIGWHSLAVKDVPLLFPQYRSVRADNDKYAISLLEITVTAPDAKQARVSQVAQYLTRPSGSNEMPYLSKFTAQTLYKNLTLDGGYLVARSAADNVQLYLDAKGTNQSSLVLSRAASNKWQMGMQASNAFFLTSIAGAGSIVQADYTGGKIVFGNAVQQTQVFGSTIALKAAVTAESSLTVTGNVVSSGTLTTKANGDYGPRVNITDAAGQGFALTLVAGQTHLKVTNSGGGISTALGNLHVALPTVNDHAATKQYVDDGLALKAPIASPTFTGTVTLPSTTSIGTVSSAEIAYLDGVTSPLQTQMNLKAPLDAPTFTGRVQARLLYTHRSGATSMNLGDPSLEEMALIGPQFNNKLWHYSNVTNTAEFVFEQTTDGVNWTPLTVDDTTRKRFVAGLDTKTLNTVTIPRTAVQYRITIRNNGTYVYINSLYMYTSTSGNTMAVEIHKKRDDGSWMQHTSDTTQRSSSPGHLYIPFTTIPWSTASTQGHYNEIRVVFTPTWSHATNTISLFGMEIWGGHPAGRRTIYTTDEDKNVEFPAGLYTHNNKAVLNTDHTAAADPHPIYLNQSRGDARYSLTGHSHTIANITSLQSTLDAKAPTASPTFTGTVTASGPVVLNGGLTGAWLSAQGVATSEAANVAGISAKFLTGGSERPSGSVDGYILNLGYSSSWAWQLYGDPRAQKIYLKTKDNGVWKPTWKQLATVAVQSVAPSDPQAGDLWIDDSAPSWSPPILVSGWTNYGEGYTPAGYLMDGSGIVHLRGLVRGGGGVIFVLPSGYRPAYSHIFAVVAGSGLARVDVAPNGSVSVVTWMANGNNDYVSLDSIFFIVGP